MIIYKLTLKVVFVDLLSLSPRRREGGSVCKDTTWNLKRKFAFRFVCSWPQGKLEVSDYFPFLLSFQSPQSPCQAVRSPGIYQDMKRTLCLFMSLGFPFELPSRMTTQGNWDVSHLCFPEGKSQACPLPVYWSWEPCFESNQVIPYSEFLFPGNPAFDSM